MKTNTEIQENGTWPNINVTPLIDVLLVLLIIFMVVTPLKPSRFETRLSQPLDKNLRVQPHIWTLIVTIDQDLRLKLNQEGDMGSVNDMGKLSAELARVFRARIENHAYKYEMLNRIDLPEEDRIERTVFIKAPRSIGYGQVVKVIDGIKGAGANPVGLQVDDLTD
jgi:biopolymer transport protein ExbD